MKWRLGVLALFLLGSSLVGVVSPARAGTGTAAVCSDGGYQYAMHERVILTSPITLALQTNEADRSYDGDYNPYEPEYRLCYSTSPAGYGGQDTTGGSITVGKGYYYDRPMVACTPQDNQSTVSTTCNWDHSTNGGDPTPILTWQSISACNNPGGCTSLSESYTVTTDEQNGWGCALLNRWPTHGDPFNCWPYEPFTSPMPDATAATLAFAVPITFCSTSCNTVTPALSRTGLLVGHRWGNGEFSLGYCTQGSCQTVYTSDPVLQTVDDQTDVSVTTPQTTTSMYSTPWMYANATVDLTPIAEVRVGSTTIPVNGPYQGCGVTWIGTNGWTQCW